MACTCNKAYQKSILTAYSTTAQTVAANADIVPATVGVNTGIAIEYTAGEAQVTLPFPGAYLVSVNADATSTATAGGLVGIQLENNGTAIPGAESSADVTSDTDIATLAFTTVVTVKPSCPMVNNKGVLTVVNNGAEASYTNVNVTVIKIA